MDAGDLPSGRYADWFADDRRAHGRARVGAVAGRLLSIGEALTSFAEGVYDFAKLASDRWVLSVETVGGEVLMPADERHTDSVSANKGRQVIAINAADQDTVL